MSNDAKKPTIFISYSEPDTAWAESLDGYLKGEGAKTWLRAVPADAAALSEIRHGLRESEYLVLILGRKADKSAPWVQFTWGAALATEKRAFVISPRGSHVDMGELPIYARNLSFYRKGKGNENAAEIARQIRAKIAGTSVA